MPGRIFHKESAEIATKNAQHKKFENAKTILRWHNSSEKTWILWEEKPGLFGVLYQSNTRKGSLQGYTFQYCYCALDDKDPSRLELEASNPVDTTKNPDVIYTQITTTKRIISGPLVKSFIKQFIEKQHGKNKGIIQPSHFDNKH